MFIRFVILKPTVCSNMWCEKNIKYAEKMSMCSECNSVIIRPNLWMCMQRTHYLHWPLLHSLKIYGCMQIILGISLACSIHECQGYTAWQRQMSSSKRPVWLQGTQQHCSVKQCAHLGVWLQGFPRMKAQMWQKREDPMEEFWSSLGTTKKPSKSWSIEIIRLNVLES